MSESKKSKSQIAKLRETGRALGADESEEAFDAALNRVAKTSIREDGEAAGKATVAVHFPFSRAVEPVGHA
jgi:hypothetical protein